MVAQVLIFLFLIGLSVVSLKYTEPLVHMIGKSDLAERYLGAGGTYTMWKLLGIIFVIAAFLTLFGQLKFGGPLTVASPAPTQSQ